MKMDTNCDSLAKARILESTSLEKLGKREGAAAYLPLKATQSACRRSKYVLLLLQSLHTLAIRFPFRASKEENSACALGRAQRTHHLKDQMNPKIGGHIPNTTIILIKVYEP